MADFGRDISGQGGFTSAIGMAPINLDPVSVQGDKATAPPPAPDPSADFAKEMSDIAQGTLKSLKADEAKAGSLNPPKLTLPPEPTTKQTSPQEAWGSAAMVIATLGSLMTRRPIVTAMNAAAGVMNAYRKGDQDAANAAFKTWQVNTDNAIKLADFQNQAYMEALQNIDHREAALGKISEAEQAAAVAKLSAAAASFGDGVMTQAIAGGGLPYAMSLINDQQAAAVKFQDNAIKLKEQQQQAQAIGEVQKSPAYQQASDVEKAAMLRRAVPGGLSDDALKQAVDIYIKTQDPSVIAHLGQGQIGQLNVAGFYNLLAKTRTEQGVSADDQISAGLDFAGAKTASRAASNVESKLEPVVKTARNAINLAEIASQAVPRNQFKFINDAQNNLKDQANDPDLTTLVTTLNGVVNTYSNALNRGSAGRISDKEHAAQLISASQTKEALSAALKQMGNELAGESLAVQMEPLQLKVNRGLASATDKAKLKEYQDAFDAIGGVRMPPVPGGAKSSVSASVGPGGKTLPPDVVDKVAKAKAAGRTDDEIEKALAADGY